MKPDPTNVPDPPRPPRPSRRPSQATVVAWLALFVALGGMASGLPGRSTVNSGDVVDDSLRSIDVRDGAIRSPDVHDQSLFADDIARHAIGTSELSPGVVTPAKIGGTPAVRVEQPQESPSCAPQSIANNATETVLWSFEDYDTSAMHTAPPSDCGAGTQSRLRAPVDGLYAVEVGVAWESDSVGTRQIALVKDGAQVVATDRRGAITGSSTIQSMTAIENLDADQFVELQVTQDSAGSLELLDAPETHLTVVWVAAAPD